MLQKVAMKLLPTSRAARHRLALIAIAAPILIAATALTMYGLRGSISYFYTPSQAIAAHVPEGQAIQLGGLVEPHSLSKRSDGWVTFVLRDHAAAARVTYMGELPDLFREGQGIVASGSYDTSGAFRATQILAKHDERYMPRQLARALKAQGVWRGEKDKNTNQ